MSDEKTIEVEVMRDFWVDNKETKEIDRIRKGTILHVPLNDQTLSGIENGSIRRFSAEAKAKEEAKKAADKKALIDKAVGKK